MFCFRQGKCSITLFACDSAFRRPIQQILGSDIASWAGFTKPLTSRIARGRPMRWQVTLSRHFRLRYNVGLVWCAVRFRSSEWLVLSGSNR